MTDNILEWENEDDTGDRFYYCFIFIIPVTEKIGNY